VATAFLVNEGGRLVSMPAPARVVLATLLALSMVQVLSRGMTKPLRDMVAGAQRIAKGGYDLRVRAESRDEVGELARAFNAMAGDLAEVDRQRRELVANVSHELRTPLNSIIGFTRLVLRKTEEQIPTLQKENLQKVLISSEHLLNLINGLLDLSKIEAGRMEVYAETFNLNDVIRSAMSTVEPLLKNGRVELIADVAPDIPPLKTDRDKLKQVMLNLLSNAVKFTEKGEIRVSASRHNGSLTLTVADTGIGMKKEALDYIFDEFRQADMSSTRRYGGTGLGLAIVKRFIDLMGGEISVESEEGKGSKFTIKLPISLKG
jgi:signal transduction histidine kinase